MTMADACPLPDHNPALNVIDPSERGFAPTKGRPAVRGKGRKVPGRRSVNKDFLDNRAAFALEKGYPKPRYVEFCEVMLAHGYQCEIHEAKKTHSKYITVISGSRRFKVRFSNHKPIKGLELAGSCDFFVGITHTGTRTTQMAIAAALKAMEKPHG